MSPLSTETAGRSSRKRRLNGDLGCPQTDQPEGAIRKKVNHVTPPLRLKKIGEFWSGRIGLRYRALAKERVDGLVWFWIGPHSACDKLGKDLAETTAAIPVVNPASRIEHRVLRFRSTFNSSSRPPARESFRSSPARAAALVFPNEISSREGNR